MAQDASPSSIFPRVLGASSQSMEAQAAVRLQVAADATLDLEDFQNAVPALSELMVVNGTGAPLADLTLTSTAEPSFLQPKTWRRGRAGAVATTVCQSGCDGACNSQPALRLLRRPVDVVPSR